jgi:hypothetical protein
VRGWVVMTIYCPKCGNDLEEKFKFCPNCGKNLNDDFIFCPGCGKKMTTTNNQPEQDITPIVSEPKRVKNKYKLPKLSFKNKRKILPITIIFVIVIAVIGATALIILNSDSTVSNTGGRSFTISITNDYHKNADCYLVTDNMRQGTFGNPGFSVNANDDATIVINEDDLMFQRESYNIKLFVTIDDVPIESVASAITESADFIIDNQEGQIDIFEVNCTGHI